MTLAIPQHDAEYWRRAAVRRARAKDKVLRPVHPNLGIAALYQRQLDGLIAEMQDSVDFHLKAAYKANPPRAAEIAQDETPTAILQRAIRDLTKRWLKRFDGVAPKLAAWFAQATDKRSADALRKILQDAGFTVEFQMTPAMRDVLAATTAQNVALIRSIPRQYFQEVEGLVMRSAQMGRDLGPLAKELQKRYGITRRRASLIATTQNNLATASMTRVRSLEAGLTEAVWVHSHAGKEPRPSHLRAGREGVRFSVDRGWFDPDEGRWIQPGELINCRCFSRPILKGFS